MTTINPTLYSGQLYQMPTSSADTSSGGTADSQTSAADAALQALSSTSGDSLLGDNSGTQDSILGSDLVDLSPQAQSVMAGLGLNSTSGAAGISALTGSSSLFNSTSGLFNSTSATAGIASITGNGFTLSTQQQQKISDILSKYKNAPDDQATYASIQADLTSAGLGPNQLAAQNEVLAFNAEDTTILADALNGNGSTSPSLPNFSSIMSSEQTNANNYMQQIYNQWQSISTTAGAQSSTTDTSSTPSTSVTA